MTKVNQGDMAATSWVSAVPALEFGQIRRHVNQMSPEDKQRAADVAIRVELGSDACALAQDYRAMGNLDRAAHWFTIAAHYRAPGARRQLDDLNALCEALTVADSQAARSADFDSPLALSVEQNANMDCQEPVVPLSVQDRTSALDVVDEANRHAEQIVTDARRQAEQIVANARRQAEQIVAGRSTASGHNLLYVAFTEALATWSEDHSRSLTIGKPQPVEIDLVWRDFSQPVVVEYKAAWGSEDGMDSSTHARRLAGRTQLLGYLESCGRRGVGDASHAWVGSPHRAGRDEGGRAVHQALADLRNIAGSDVAALVAEVLDGGPVDRLTSWLVEEELGHRMRQWLPHASPRVAALVLRALARVETGGLLRSDQELGSAMRTPVSSHRRGGGLYLPKLHFTSPVRFQPV